VSGRNCERGEEEGERKEMEGKGKTERESRNTRPSITACAAFAPCR